MALTNLSVLLCIFLLYSITGVIQGKSCEPTLDAGEKCTKYPCIIFEDNFDTLDHDKWQHEITASGGGNWEFQYYTNNRSNSFTKNGVLYLKPTLTEDRFRATNFLSSGTLDLWGMNGPYQTCTGAANYGCKRTGSANNPINPIQSARIRTVNSFTFTYGKMEVRAKLPKGNWIWPAIWLLPRQFEYGDWPASGEIDLVEARANERLFKDGISIGIDQVGSTLHWGPFFGANSYFKTHATKNLKSGTFADDFHVFSFQWDENGMDFFVDNENILQIKPDVGGFWKLGDYAKKYPGIDNPWINGGKMAPFDRDFYIIMNVAVGGTGYFSDRVTPKKPWTNTSPHAARDFWNAKNSWFPTWKGDGAAMKIDYVKVWKLKANPGNPKGCNAAYSKPQTSSGSRNRFWS